MRIGGGAVSIADVTDRTARDLGFVRKFWLNEIRAGRAFSEGAGLAASAGNFSEIQLINPAGSGITVIVFKALVGQGVAGNVSITNHNVNLATDVGAGRNLLIGGAAGAAHVRTAQPAAQDGSRLARVRMAADEFVPLLSDWSYELGVGEGIIIMPDTVNTILAATYFWIEV